MNTDTSYYDKESNVYSRNRYQGALQSYTQFLFRKRLSIFLKMLSEVVSSQKGKQLSILEIGCADGVIIQNILKSFPHSWSGIVGLDISPKMLEEARKNISDSRVAFFSRGQEPQRKYDIIVRLGVHTENISEEIAYVKERLRREGYLFYSVAGQKSLHAQIKLKGRTYLSDYKTYAEYEKAFLESFTIIDSKLYAFFVPKLWAIPFLGRIFQPIIDVIFSHIFPEFFHEKLYLLKLR